MKLKLQAAVEPSQWPMDRMQDVIFNLTVTNESRTAVPVYPKVAGLRSRVSVASMGVEWDLVFEPLSRGVIPQSRELRTYYGPPGEPVEEKWMRKTALVLKPGQVWKSQIHACWIPNAVFKPGQLDPQILDPDGYDNVIPPRQPELAKLPNRPPSLKESFPLSRASVLVLNANRDMLGRAMAEKNDFLRGNQVIFFAGPDQYRFKAVYRQADFMVPIEVLEATSQPVNVRIGE